MYDFILLNERYKFKFKITIDKKNHGRLMSLLKKSIHTDNIILKGLLNAAGTDFALKKIANNSGVNKTVRKAIQDAALKKGIIVNITALDIKTQNDLYLFEFKFVIDSFSNVLEGIKSFVPKMTSDKDYRKIICNFIDELKFSIPDTCKAGFTENIINRNTKEICNIIEKRTNEKGACVKINDMELKVKEIKN